MAIVLQLLKKVPRRPSYPFFTSRIAAMVSASVFDGVNALIRATGRSMCGRTRRTAHRHGHGRSVRTRAFLAKQYTADLEWNRVAAQISIERGLSFHQNVHLFDLLNVTMADAVIACWDSKYRYSFCGRSPRSAKILL